MKHLYLIRHAKSSWSDPDLTDFSRPLNKRGKKDAPEMARRLAAKGICPQLIVSSPAKRARKTAICMAEGMSYDTAAIRYDTKLYLGSMAYHLQVIETLFRETDVLFLVGHNGTITELAELLTGIHFGNVPTCGVVSIAYEAKDGFSSKEGAGELLFFDYPKSRGATTTHEE